MTSIALALAFVLSAGAPNAGFEKLKTLEGNWKADSASGPMFLSLKLVAGNSALLETTTGKDRSKILMTSVYSLDGNDLVLSHFSDQGNQPRMRAKPLDAGKVRFDAYEVLNLKDPKANHTSAVTFVIKDSDHFSQEWTQLVGGKEQKLVYDFQREYVDTLK